MKDTTRICARCHKNFGASSVIPIKVLPDGTMYLVHFFCATVGEAKALYFREKPKACKHNQKESVS